MTGQVKTWNAGGWRGNRQKVLDNWAGFADYPKAANADA
jgi:hypothetical protein